MVQHLSSAYKCTLSVKKEVMCSLCLIPTPSQLDFSYSNRKLEHFFPIPQGLFVRYLHTFVSLTLSPCPLPSSIDFFFLNTFFFLAQILTSAQITKSNKHFEVTFYLTAAVGQRGCEEGQLLQQVQRCGKLNT